MADTMRDQLDRVERKPLKCSLESSSEARKKVSSDRCEHGQLVARALESAHITRGQAAGYMGISEGLLSRQIENIDNQHLSWQRLFRLPDRFWRQLWWLVAKQRKLARVRRRVVFEMEESA